MKPEEKVKAVIKKWLHQHGAYFFMPVQTGYGAATVDFLVCINGRFLGIETKAAGIKQPSPRQRLVMDAIEAAGGIAICCDSLESFCEQYERRR